MYASFVRNLCVYCHVVAFAVFLRRSLALPTRQPARDWCTDDMGRHRRLYEKWIQNRQICECIYPESLSFAWDLRNPSDATPHCQLNGCTNRVTGEYMVTGQNFTQSGSICTCTAGPDPDLMDYATPFHLSCLAQTHDISDDIRNANARSGITLEDPS